MGQPIEGFIRLRMSGADAHYAGGLVDGARILQLISDAVTEALIHHDGDEGLMRAIPLTRHPEVAAKRPSKDAAKAGPSPFEARFARTSG